MLLTLDHNYSSFDFLSKQAGDGRICQIGTVSCSSNFTRCEEHNLFGPLALILGAHMTKLTGEPGPAQNCEFHQNFCWKVPFLGSSWSRSWVKVVFPVVLTAPAASMANSSPFSNGGANIPARRPAVTAPIQASTVIAEARGPFMTNGGLNQLKRHSYGPGTRNAPSNEQEGNETESSKEGDIVLIMSFVAFNIGYHLPDLVWRARAGIVIRTKMQIYRTKGWR